MAWAQYDLLTGGTLTATHCPTLHARGHFVVPSHRYSESL